MSALSDALNAANTNDWSAREISRRSRGALSHSVVADYLGGREAKRPKEYVLEAFVDVFPTLTVQQLRELAGYSAGEPEPYEIPEEAHRLDARQRAAVTELIRLLAASKAGGEHGGDTAATNQPGTGPDLDNVKSIEPRVVDVLQAQEAARTVQGSEGKQRHADLQGLGEESQGEAPDGGA